MTREEQIIEAEKPEDPCEDCDMKDICLGGSYCTNSY